MKNVTTQSTGRIILCFLLSVTLVSTLSLVWPDVAHATTSAEKQAEADEIMNDIDNLQTSLNEANDQLALATEEYDTASAAADAAAERMVEIEAEIKELQETLSGRVSSMYKTGGAISYLDVFFKATSFEEFVAAFDMYDKIVDQDTKLIQQSKDLHAEAEEVKEEHESQKALAAEKMETIEENKAEIESLKASMENTLEKVNEEIVLLKAKEEEERIQEEEAKKRAEEAASLAQSTIAPSINYGSGSSGSGGGGSVSSSGWAHPLPGYAISNPFGWAGAWDGVYHNGTDFAAPTGTPIRAALAGTVSFVGSYGTGGNAVILSHGSGIRTIYMHMSAFGCSMGQSVSAGETIGYVGSTGYSTGPHLHFQVEVNGTPVDPMSYI